MADSNPNSTEPAAVRTLLVFAHPALERGRVNPLMCEAVADLPNLTVHDLYEAYPDFTIDVPAEHRLMLAHDLIVLQFPIYWFAMPSLLKEWLDLSWSRGFAFGQGARLKGRTLMCAVSTGANRDAYENGVYRFPLADFLAPVKQTAEYCGLNWVEPFVLHGAQALELEGMEKGMARYRSRLQKVAAAVQPVARRRPADAI
ncbi:MAG: NAD(P)H-dependent oxidoreductase [Caulobacteraceae bacterium]|nr:NAD(P)H-dependent oxidoreductase [Caulobacteraceae bacterium]